jgi:2-polyprenyl-3-methyl-5-hydroxy-6-metoxy-1,4-benzoquinol methylase
MSTEKYSVICEREASRLKVSPEIHPEDFIFQFLIEHPGFEEKENAIKYYFSDGLKSANKLKSIIFDICDFGKPAPDILEFASGYGCVTRHLKNVLPDSAVTACDIHEMAINFIKEQLKTDAVLSASRPGDLNLNKRYDLVFALSFFSHMPKNTFAQWLEKLFSLVKPEGYLIFTTHGVLSVKNFPPFEFDDDGFFFFNTSEQKDLDTVDYGVAVTKPEYVLRQLFELPNLTLKNFHEGFWWTHQDLYVVKKKKSSSEM